jgi:uncharacterized protein YkwD
VPPVAAIVRRNHRRRIAAPLAAATVLIATGLWAAAPAGAATCRNADARITHISTAAARGAVVCLINDTRRAHGLPAVRQSGPLDVAARIWSNAMVANSVFAHSPSFGQRVTNAGLVWQALAENIATGFPTPRGVVQAWMASLDHCQNILDPTYRDVGIGINVHAVPGYATHLGTWTADFALPMGRSAPSHNWAPFNRCPY